VFLNEFSLFLLVSLFVKVYGNYFELQYLSSCPQPENADDPWAAWVIILKWAAGALFSTTKKKIRRTKRTESSEENLHAYINKWFKLVHYMKDYRLPKQIL
jgi:hypothetical protein